MSTKHPESCICKGTGQLTSFGAGGRYWVHCGGPRADLTEAQKDVMYRLEDEQEGSVSAGHDAANGRVRRVAASTLRALARKGLVVLELSSEGGMSCRLADTPR